MIVNIILFVINKCIAPLIEGYIILKICNALLEKKFKNRFIELSIILESALVIEIIASLDSSKNLIQQISILLLLIIIIHINYKGTVYKKIISYGLFMLIVFLGETFTMLIFLVATDKNISVFMTSSYYYMWGVIISKMIQVILLRLFINRILKDNVDVDNDYKNYIIGLILFILIIFFVLTETMQIYAVDLKYIESYIIIIINSAILCISSLVIFIFRRIIFKTHKKAEQQQLLEQYELEHKYSRELNKILDNLRILKHDLKNHISCMWGLVETDNIEDFKLYLSKLTDELDGYDEDAVAIDIVNNKE